MIITDTLKAVRRLEAAGFSQDQAEAMVHILNEHSTELISATDLKSALSQFKRDLVITLGGLMITLTGIILAAMRFI